MPSARIERATLIVLVVLSLAIWPVMTAVAAFVAALVAAILFSRVWRRV